MLNKNGGANVRLKSVLMCAGSFYLLVLIPAATAAISVDAFFHLTCVMKFRKNTQAPGFMWSAT
jgi:hypothetical protein